MLVDKQELLEPLIHPVYFICKNINLWKDVLDSVTPPPVELIYERFRSGVDIWPVQTYIQLKRRGLNVYLTPNYVPGSICIAHYDNLALKELAFNSYVVACQCDRTRPDICEQRIVQNQLNVIDQTDHFIPHWPQPALKPRLQSRGTKIENITFKGNSTYNLAEPFKSCEFLDKLQSLGMNLSISSDSLEGRYNAWIDYTEADVVLAVRNGTEYGLSIKPPSKLINAWFAGCPALLGPEPAYQNLRVSELDYIEVCNPDDVIAALLRLRDNSDLYTAMVENGFRRAKEFTDDNIALLWRDLLAGPITEDYERWLGQSLMQKLIGRPIHFVWSAINHKYKSDGIHFVKKIKFREIA